MKTLHILLLLMVGTLAALLAGCKGDRSDSSSTSSSTTAAHAEEAVFDIEGMTCASCNIAVKVAAEKVAGVRSARASHEQKRAWVSYEPTRTSPSVIAKAITKAGYRATAANGAQDVPATKSVEGGETHVGVGIVKSVLEGGKKLIVDHEEIPGWMKAMEMVFDVADPQISTNIQVDDRIRFTVAVDDNGHRITRIEKIN